MAWWEVRFFAIGFSIMFSGFAALPIAFSLGLNMMVYTPYFIIWCIGGFALGIFYLTKLPDEFDRREKLYQKEGGN